MENRNIGIRSLDIQTGLYKYNDPILDLKIGETIVIPANMPHSVKGKTKLKFSLTIVK